MLFYKCHMSGGQFVVGSSTCMRGPTDGDSSSFL